MIRRHLLVLRLGLMVLDGFTATVLFLLVSRVRFGDGIWQEIWSGIGIDIRLASLAFGLTWVGVLWLEGLYRLRVRWRLLTELKDIVKATVLIAALTLSALFIFKQEDVSRLFLVILFVVQPLATFAGRAVLRFGFGYLRSHGHNPHFMLIVGTGQLAQRFADRVDRRAALGIHVIGHLSVGSEDRPKVTRPVLGTLDDIGTIFHTRVVDEIAVCLPPESAGYIEPIARLAADEGKTVRIAVDPLEGTLPNAREEEFDGFVVRSLVHDSHRELGFALKRMIDIGGAILGLLVLSPLFLAVAVAIRVRDGSPVLFRQQRIGLHGRPFTMYKFRTMVADAEARLGEVRHLNERDGPAFKASNDPRMTRLGRTLRSTSLDELPQLWNVLRGEMSLVGPRPPLPGEVTNYDIWHRRRLSMKPGVTGLWQVEGRREPHFDRWVERDLTYIDSWSLWLDVKILGRTISAVVARGGR